MLLKTLFEVRDTNRMNVSVFVGMIFLSQSGIFNGETFPPVKWNMFSRVPRPDDTTYDLKVEIQKGQMRYLSCWMDMKKEHRLRLWSLTQSWGRAKSTDEHEKYLLLVRSAMGTQEAWRSAELVSSQSPLFIYTRERCRIKNRYLDEKIIHSIRK